MLKSQITREELELLGAEIRRHIGLDVVERGLELQQKGYVYNTEVLPEGAIVSKVQDSVVFEVRLEPGQFGQSVCSCPYEAHCEHQAAVFFYTYAVYARPDAFVKEWKHRQDAQPQAPAAKASRLHRQTALAPSAQPDTAPLKEAASAEEWLTHIDSELDAFLERHPSWKYELEEYYSAAVQTAIRPSAWWLPGTKRLLTIQALLAAMRRMEKQFAFDQSGRNLSQYKQAAGHLTERIDELCDASDTKETAARWPEHAQRIGAYISEQLHRPADPPLVRWIQLYRIVWARLLVDPAWREREEIRLERLLNSPGSPSFENDAWRKAKAHFDMLAERDREAWRRLEQLPAFHPEEGLFYIGELRRAEQWERLWRWLQWLLPQCGKTDRDLFRKLCAYAAEAAKPLQREDEWARALVSLLPSSYYVYTEFLIQAGRFRDWIDYHTLEQAAIPELYPADLRTIETHDPRLVLPLYHQSIERNIAQKNRNAYKEAIRLIKKLATLYDGARQPERFEQYLQHLSLHYSRLRAFREELKKGKLLR